MGSIRSVSWARVVPVTIALVVVLAQSGCAFFPSPQTSITGHVYGDPLVTLAATARTTSPALVPLRATVTCNSTSTTAGSDGAYSLSVNQTNQYSCTISAQNYVAVSITISSTAGTKVHLDLGSAAPATAAATPTATPAATGCTVPVVTSTAICPSLHLKPGTISGVLTSADTQQPIAGATITCWQPNAPSQPSQTVSTTATGAFSIDPMPAGPYGCIAAGDPTLYSGTLQPGGTAPLEIVACVRHCPAISFHNGPIMHNMTAYLIFWLPRGHTFEPAGSDTRFESLMAQYLSDIGGSAFYGLLTQYWDRQGSVVNNMTFGGTYVDTTAYPHAGTPADPLSSDDIENEIQQDVRTNAWTLDGEHEVFIFTGYNVESCATSGGSRDCSFSSDGRHYCAYHSDFPITTSDQHVIYAYLPVLSDCTLQELSTSGSPNHDALADSTINSMSHEHFESVTDPTGKGWFDTDPSSGEIGDKCQYRFGTIRADGSNVTLGHGHAYLLQSEWSNHVQGCVFQ